MTKTKNLDYDTPRQLRTREYGEHLCFIFKDGQYIGTLYLNNSMRKLWRSNKFGVVMVDV